MASPLNSTTTFRHLPPPPPQPPKNSSLQMASPLNSSNTFRHLPPPPPPSAHPIPPQPENKKFASYCCFIRKKENKKAAVEEIDVLRFDDHKKVREDVVQQPGGGQTVVLTIDEDIHLEGQIRKNEGIGKEGRKKEKSSSGEIVVSNPIATEIGGTSSSGSASVGHHLTEQHKP